MADGIVSKRKSGLDKEKEYMVKKQKSIKIQKKQRKRSGTIS